MRFLVGNEIVGTDIAKLLIYELRAKVGHKHYSKQTSVRNTHYKTAKLKIASRQKSLINSTIAKATVEIFYYCFLSTFGDNDGHMTNPPDLSLKIILQ
jgi:hypothetical protein